MMRVDIEKIFVLKEGRWADRGSVVRKALQKCPARQSSAWINLLGGRMTEADKKGRSAILFNIQAALI
jgi:hypothetical protein